MKIADRVDNIEAALVRHLEESGSIRTDLAWLKKAFWTLSAAVVAAVISQFVKPGATYVNQAGAGQQSVSEMQQKP